MTREMTTDKIILPLPLSSKIKNQILSQKNEGSRLATEPTKLSFRVHIIFLPSLENTHTNY